MEVFISHIALRNSCYFKYHLSYNSFVIKLCTTWLLCILNVYSKGCGRELSSRRRLWIVVDGGSWWRMFDDQDGCEWPNICASHFVWETGTVGDSLRKPFQKPANKTLESAFFWNLKKTYKIFILEPRVHVDIISLVDWRNTAQNCSQVRCGQCWQSAETDGLCCIFTRAVLCLHGY